MVFFFFKQTAECFNLDIMHVIISRGTHPYNETFTLMEMWSVCVWEEEAKFTYIQHGATESYNNRQPESESPSNKRQRADWKCLIHNLTNHSQSANIWKDLPCYQTKLSPTVGQSHRSHDTESISSLAALYNSSLFAHCCLLSINVGSSSNNVPQLCTLNMAKANLLQPLHHQRNYFMNMFVLSFCLSS